MRRSSLASAIARLVSDGVAEAELDARTERLLSETYVLSARLFSLPITQKCLNTLPEGCGYRPFGIEFSGRRRRRDRTETFSACTRMRTRARGLPSREARDLHLKMEALISALTPSTKELLAELARHSGAEGWEASDSMLRWSTLQVTNLIPTAPGQLINAPHEDGHIITIAHATGPGLEVRGRDGRYRAIDRQSGRVLLMPGEAGFRMSGGLIRPLFHRVVAKCSERMALLWFVDLSPDDCRSPWQANELNHGVDIGDLVLSNSTRFGVPGFLAD